MTDYCIFCKHPLNYHRLKQDCCKENQINVYCVGRTLNRELPVKEYPDRYATKKCDCDGGFKPITLKIEAKVS